MSNRNHVYILMLEQFAGPRETWKVLGELLLSMLLGGALAVGCYWWLVHGQIKPGGVLLAILAAWVLGFFLGQLLGGREGIADGLLSEARASRANANRLSGSFFNSYRTERESERATQMLHLGYLLIFTQLIFGHYHKAVRYFTGGAAARARLATTVMSVLLESEDTTCDQLAEALRDAYSRAGERFQAAELDQVLARLQELGYVEGEEALRVNPARKTELIS